MPPHISSTTLPPIVLIGGPTASGKSAIALRLGERLVKQGQRAVILNADALQLYRDLRVITARPSVADEARLPHRLYGVVDAAERGSVASWLGQIREEIEAALAKGWTPIVVGGTGMYLHTLQNGLAQIPEIAPELRSQAVLKHSELGGKAYRAELAALDPIGAAKLHDGDTQRLIRTYEVVLATGRPLHEWQSQQTDKPPAHWRFCNFIIEPTRPVLYANCDRRFDLMLADGAMDEVRKLGERGLDPNLPAMKAVGVPELLSVQTGTLTIDQAREKAQQATRNYAKRQLTWFRHQIPNAVRVELNQPGAVDEIDRHIEQIHTIIAKRD